MDWLNIPDANPVEDEEQTPEHGTVASGVLRNCYVCGRPVASLPEAAVRRTKHERTRREPDGTVVIVWYFMTVCGGCVHHLEPIVI
jgi:hypothetical protein